MKIRPISISNIFIVFFGLFSFLLVDKTLAQGFNENEWIFGHCEGMDNNFISFGKDGIAKAQNIPGSITFGKGNAAIAVDPITGKVLFYTDGALVYNYLNEPMQGVVGELGGSEIGRQTVAISELDYSPQAGQDKLFYIFYLNASGELDYSIADMNDQGGAQADHPPAGTVSNGGSLGPASGAITVVKTAGSPNYLISFEDGNLVSREIGDAAGDFTEIGGLPLNFTPKAFIFDKENQTLLVIPSALNVDLLQIPFDTSTGEFGTAIPYNQSGSGSPVEGAAFSPDGDYLYFSQGGKLLRIPTSDPAASPEEIPLTADIFKVYDIKPGPDGQLYYIYEETEGGPQLVGRVTNPDEAELEALEAEEDPFNGTDFCGRVFPVFAPNIDLENQVDFTWEPMDPCMNNPLQLTSQIFPENYQPVSFEWVINPPLTDEEGEELEIDLNEEHLLLPAQATSQESISVTLTVTFANGETRNVTHNISFQENNLQAQFSASDTTLCEPQCIDLMELLEVQSGDQQGGGQPGGGGGIGIPGLPGGGGQPGGGQQGGNYEYFWSNKKEEGWTSEAPNEVCLPGFYWVLVREQGSSCYAYASTRVKIWDMEDQSNNIWYFGNGAGLDFNRDPDDPEAPTPRPIENPHPQNIPAGVTTISDQAGEVLFYTDGQTVWDLNGNPMQNGENIGGDNQSSQSVLAVPLPQEETLFYLFTTQTSAGGNSQVNFSLVDIKGDNPQGVGNVVSSNNFLFSPSTQHTAALGAGDTTWVAFHELGNNTFRFYPVSNEGIGQPVFSSVGGDHNFGTGVGSMKFSPDGTKLAVTINDGGNNRVEIFDFDQETGELTEYAILDLGSAGEVYGLEFSEDAGRILVSYRNGGPGIEEFFIQSTESTDNSDPDNPVTTTCPDCFENAVGKEAIQQCILNSRTTIADTQGLNLGALQIGPDGQIYAAIVGSNLIGQIQVEQNCGPSRFNQNAVEPMPGTSNLGLPSFVQNSGSNIPDPSLAGPERLCLDPELGAFGIFEGGGEPDIDRYSWTIIYEEEAVVHTISGLGEEFQTLEYSFTAAGIYEVILEVERCGTPWEEAFRMEVEVYDVPKITLPSEIPLCNDNTVNLTAVDPDDPELENYTFVWLNAAGDTLGTENALQVTEESIYTVTVAYRLPDGADPEMFQTCPATQSVFVGPAFQFEIDQTAEEVCLGETVTFIPDTPVSGNWFALMDGAEERIALGEFFELELSTDDLPAPGSYEIIFQTADPLDSTCMVEKTMELLVNPLPEWIITQRSDADGCETDNGSVTLRAVTNIDSLIVEETNEVFTLVEDETIELTGLPVGSYTLTGINNGCATSSTVVIVNRNPPSELEYITTGVPEKCGDPNTGLFRFEFPNGPASGTYIIRSESDGLTLTADFTSESVLEIPVAPGVYKVEMMGEDGCRNPNSTTFYMDPVPEADFSIPSQVSSCGAFTFSPVSNAAVKYTLIDGAGTRSEPSADGSFTIIHTGTYTVLGEGIDPTDNLCPVEKTIRVDLEESVDFELIAPDASCEGPFTYEVDLLGRDPSTVNIRWLDANGQRVGSGLEFTPASSGNYSVEVAPAGVINCAGSREEFSTPETAIPIDIELEYTPFCGEDAFTTLSIDADMTQVGQIFWFVLTDGNFENIPNSEDEESVSVSSGGTYRVVLYNELGCEIGQDEVVITRSVTVPPVLEERYIICPSENIIRTLNPGDYDSYEWILDNEVLSTNAAFTPTLPGHYQLHVADDAGCEFILEFVVEEDCELRISFPTAIVPDSRDKNFIIYANEFIDEVETLIYNRWGELIFHCTHENVEPGTSFCPWNGRVNGKLVPIGTYPVIVRFKSENQGVEKTIKTALVVIE
jgi:WD40 repeat protein